MKIAVWLFSFFCGPISLRAEIPRATEPLTTPLAVSTTLTAQWNELPSGIFGSVWTMSMHNDDLYVAGAFIDAGGVADADYIARWDGCDWYAVAPGMTGVIYEMIFSGNDIIVGGDFENAGGNPDADRIARWNGTGWNGYGPGLNAFVHALAITNNGLFAGGDFTDAGGNPNADRIARWDGASWQSLGTGLNDITWVIATQGTQVYAGGQFTDAGGNTQADHIALWNGSTWQPVGSGLNDQIWNMGMNGTSLYVIGSFTEAGGNQDANFIAKWNGTSWVNLGNYFQAGSDLIINAVQVVDEAVYLGVSDINAAAWLMKWDIPGSSWTVYPPDYPDYAPIAAILPDAFDLYVGNVNMDGGGGQGNGEGDNGCGVGDGFHSIPVPSIRGNGGVLRWGEPIPEVIIDNAPSFVCFNDPPVPLPTVQNGLFGLWSGPGVINNVFHPEGLSGAVMLTFTPEPGPCIGPVTYGISVIQNFITLQVPGQLCENSAPLYLPPVQSNINGTWSGAGVSNNTFDPGGLTGSVTLTFTPDPGTCAAMVSTSILVTEPSTPVLSGVPPQLCDLDLPVILPVIQNGIPGEWSGPGVTGNVFTPSGLSGLVPILFTPLPDECAEPVSTEIMVNPSMLISLTGVPDTICPFSPPVSLPVLQSGVPGEWSGPGISNNVFNPSGLQGSIPMTFTPAPDACAYPALTSVWVFQEMITLSGIPDALCELESPIPLPVLQDGLPGHWDGVGVKNDIFSPQGLSGIIGLTFTVTTSTCSLTSLAEILVQEAILPEDSGLPQMLCADMVPLALPLVVSGVAGAWSGPGVTNNLFNPASLEGQVSLLFTPFAGQCAIPMTTSLEVQVPISPAFSFLPDSLCATSTPIQLTAEQSGITGNWFGQGVANNLFNPYGLADTVLLTFLPDSVYCALPAFDTLMVIPAIIPSFTGVPGFVCSMDAPLPLPMIQNQVPGTWKGPGVQRDTLFPSGLGGYISLRFIPDSLQCAQANSVTIYIHQPPVATNLSAICDTVTQTYTISFDIAGGDSATYTINGIPLSGTHFISSPIPSDSIFYSFILEDSYGCRPFAVIGAYDCSCTTFAGNMILEDAPRTICIGPRFNSVYDGMAHLSPGDILAFVLHDNAGNILGHVFSISPQPLFTFQPGMIPGQVYYVSAVAGLNTGTGELDLTDPCLSVTPGAPVIFVRCDPEEANIHPDHLPETHLEIPFLRGIHQDQASSLLQSGFEPTPMAEMPTLLAHQPEGISQLLELIFHQRPGMNINVLQMYDRSGKLVYHQRYLRGLGSHTTVKSLHHSFTTAPGVYYWKAVLEDKNRKVAFASGCMMLID